jgi:hypothetical protein
MTLTQLGWVDLLENRVKDAPPQSILLDIGICDVDATVINGCRRLPPSVAVFSIGALVPLRVLAEIDAEYRAAPGLARFALRRGENAELNAQREAYAKTLECFSGIVLERTSDNAAYRICL